MQSLAERVKAHWEELRDSERPVAQYLAENQSAVLFSAATAIARETGSSDATVIRTARALGYSGLPELKRQIGIYLTREIAPSERLEETISRSSDDEDGPVLAAIRDAEDTHQQMKDVLRESDITAAAELVLEAREILAWGLGSSATAARYAADRLSRVGRPTYHLDSSGFQLASDLINVRKDSCVLLFVPGRPHPDLKLLLHATQAIGAKTVLVSNAHSHDIRRRATCVVELPHSTTKLTSEVLSEVLLVDILSNTLLGLDAEVSRQARRKLTEYRRFLDEAVTT